MYNKKRGPKASQPKYLGVLSEKIIMASTVQANKTRYSLLPRTSEDSHLSNVTEEDAPSVHIENRALLPPRDEESRSYKFKIDTTWVPWFLRGLSFALTISTLIVESIRLARSNNGDWRYRRGDARCIAPIIAFLSFDVLIHLTVVPYFIISHYFYYELVFTDHSSIKTRGPQKISSNRHQHPHTSQVLNIVMYILEVFVVITFVVGLIVDLAGARRKPLEVAAQLLGWFAIVFRILAILWPKKGTVTLSLTYKNHPHQSISPTVLPTNPERSYYHDVEDNRAEAEDREAQPEPVVQEQTTGLI